ncbi:Zinc finger protein 782 [Eumeta japonica]|uniref:Zinc finger protein 782 n=1 Tax=Eumeta variegata TaxID=151549 RepID=A0A4C1ZWX4_EUMVA|nr:Zinc finger protein 782 [Eumeta japonica]
MDIINWNIRECSVQLRRCDNVSRGSAVRALDASHVTDRCQDFNKMPMTIKAECDQDVASEILYAGHAHQDPIAEVGLLVKEEDDSIIKTETEDGTNEVEIKEELVIGPIVLQSNTTPHIQEDDSIIKTETEDGTNEVEIKEELVIGPIVLQSNTTPHIQTYNPASTRSDLTQVFCSVFDQSATQTEIEDIFYEDSRIFSDDSFALNVKRTDNAYQRVLKEQSLGDERTSTATQEGSQYRYHVRLHSEWDYGTNASGIEADAQAAEKQCKYRYWEHSISGKSDLMDYKQTHTGAKSYYCEQCEYSASDVVSLKRHLHIQKGVELNQPDRVDEKRYKCDYCEYSTTRLSNLTVHRRTHTGEKPYKCDRCEFTTPHHGNLKMHLRTHTDERSYKCEHCEYSASGMSNLKRHIRTHTGEKPYKCELCKFSTSQLVHLKIHMRTHTGERPYKCEHCEYSASGTGNLKRHIRTHTGKKPHKCELCKFSTSQLVHLKIHMRTHTGERPYKCKQCEYSASYSRSLKAHMRTHTGQRPHKCEQCEYSSSEICNLKMHMRTHTGEKPYKCQYCEHSSSRLANLRRHMRIHTK